MKIQFFPSKPEPLHYEILTTYINLTLTLALEQEK